MALRCPECSYTSQFKSALQMHKQLDHDMPHGNSREERKNKGKRLVAKQSSVSISHSSSATRLFSKLRSKLSRSRSLFSHPEDVEPVHVLAETSTSTPRSDQAPNLSASQTLEVSRGETSRHCKVLPENHQEIYRCHICDFKADRITVLDRHLLNFHNIGLDNLLKLVLAKTQDALNESNLPSINSQPYYKAAVEHKEDEFAIENTSKVKIFKHAASNTDLKWWNIPNTIPEETPEPSEDLMTKIENLNDCICKFVNSTNTIKKVLCKGMETKQVRSKLRANEPMFELCLGDNEDTPRNWERERPKSEKVSSSTRKSRSSKSKLSADSYYFCD